MLIIPGFTPDDKVPGVVAHSQWGAGPISIGAIALVCVLFGNPGASGTATLSERVPVTTEEEADTLFEARSELANMAHAALEIPGVTLECCPVEEAAGGTSSYLKINVGGSWSAGGEVAFQFDETPIRVNAAPSHTPTTFAAAIVSAINQARSGRLFCSATSNVGVVTAEVFSKGNRGNQHRAFMDASRKPAGMTISLEQYTPVAKSGAGPAITVAGTATLNGTYELTITLGGANGTATFAIERNGVEIAAGVTVPTTPFTYPIPGDTSSIITFGNGTHVLSEVHSWQTTVSAANGSHKFHGGTGVDDIQDAIDGTESATNDYIGLAHNDVTNVGIVESACNAKAAFDIGKLESYFTGVNGTLTEAIALAQAGMNDQLGMCVWAQEHPAHPSTLAARTAAYASIIEGADPNHNYDDEPLIGTGPHFKGANDNPSRSTLKTALNNSVTPLVTTDDTLTFVRAICSRSLNGATPDYRTYDRGDVAVAIRVRKEAVALGQQLREQNKYVGPDVLEGLPPTGTMTPALWLSKISAKMQEWEGPEYNWLEQVAENPPQATWEKSTKRIMSVIPTIAKSQFHQLGVIVRQQAA